VTAVAGTLWTNVMNLDVPVGHVFGPRNKPFWPERLMTSAALTGRTIVELSLPGVSWDLLKCFGK
jgi:hypothetical protein